MMSNSFEVIPESMAEVGYPLPDLNHELNRACEYAEQLEQQICMLCRELTLVKKALERVPSSVNPTGQQGEHVATLLTSVDSVRSGSGSLNPSRPHPQVSDSTDSHQGPSGDQLEGLRSQNAEMREVIKHRDSDLIAAQEENDALKKQIGILENNLTAAKTMVRKGRTSIVEQESIRHEILEKLCRATQIPCPALQSIDQGTFVSTVDSTLSNYVSRRDYELSEVTAKSFAKDDIIADLKLEINELRRRESLAADSLYNRSMSQQ